MSQTIEPMPKRFASAAVLRIPFALLLLAFSIVPFAQQSDPNEFVSLLYNARKLSGEKRWNEALPLWEQAAERNPVNGEYAANLATAYYNTKQYGKAIDTYKKQLELGYGLVGNAAYNIACCYALSGNKAGAIPWLEKALFTGFNNFSLARTDEDLALLRDDRQFKKLFGLDDVRKMSRTEGWRYDMELLKREVMRKAYLRRELSLEAFSRQYDELDKTVAQKTDLQIILALQKLMVSLGDGHSSIFPPSRPEF